MTTEEVNNFNRDNEDIEIDKYFAYLGSVINSNRHISQEITRRPRLGKTAMEELQKVIGSKDVSLEAKAKIIHTFVSPVTMYGRESCTVKEVDGGKMI